MKFANRYKLYASLNINLSGSAWFFHKLLKPCLVLSFTYGHNSYRIPVILCNFTLCTFKKVDWRVDHLSKILFKSDTVPKTFTIFLKIPASVGRNVVLTSGCIIGAACSVTSNEDIEENSVIYGANCERRVQKERPPVGLNI